MTIKWYQLLFQIVNFGVLIFILKRFLYHPIVKIVEQRNQKIQDSIKAAENNLKEKTKIEELKKLAIREAEKEAVTIVEAARKEATNSGKDIIKVSKVEAEKEIDKKYQLMIAKLANQEKQIETNVVGLVIDTTARVLKDSLSSKEQQTIISQQIKKLKKSSK